MISDDGNAPSAKAPASSATASAGETHGRYTIFEPFARGGMASVHFGAVRGDGGFVRLVAIKRLHEQLAADPELVAMLRDEAHLSALVHHGNVIPILDVVTDAGQVLLVMDYVEGESLAKLVEAAARRHEPVACSIVSAIVGDVLSGLHAAHTAREADGAPREIVHRDVSPQNILVGTDGIARVLDFGVARAHNRAQSTRTGQIKGKLRYLSPEQIHGVATPRSDTFAAGIVAWELVTGARLFARENDGATLAAVLSAKIPRPTDVREDVPPALEDAILRSLTRNAEARFSSAREMAQAILAAAPPAGHEVVGQWVSHLAADALADRRTRTTRIESLLSRPARSGPPPTARPPPPHGLFSRRQKGGLVVAVGLLSAVLVLAAARRGHPGAEAAPTEDPRADAPAAAASLAEPTDPAGTAQADEPVGAAPPRPPVHRRPPRPASTCNPPFAFDDAGHKHFNVRCL
jgi:serine/threonine protein kinase